MLIPADTIQYLQRCFDKILVISVPRFTNRHKLVKNNLQGLQFNFFWGADKYDINFEAAKLDGTYDEKRAVELQRQGKSLNVGELACALSHRMVYQEMVKQQWQRLLILEDDVLPLYDELISVPDALDELPADWDLVYLGYLKNEKVTFASKIKKLIYELEAPFGLIKWSKNMVHHLLPKPYSKHLKIAGFHDCTHAYAITLEAAIKLLALQTPVVYRADDLLSHTILKGDLNGFVTVPKFFDQETFHNPAIVSEIR